MQTTAQLDKVLPSEVIADNKPIVSPVCSTDNSQADTPDAPDVSDLCTHIEAVCLDTAEDQVPARVGEEGASLSLADEMLQGLEAHPYVKAPELGQHGGKDAEEEASEAQGLEELIDGVACLLTVEDDAEKCGSSAASEAGDANLEKGADDLVEDEEEWKPPTSTLEEANAKTHAMLDTIKQNGIPVIDLTQIKFGKTLGKGAFGTVKLAEVQVGGKADEYAVKTIVAKGKKFDECLEAFETEALVSWQAAATARKSKEGFRSRVCRTIGVAYELDQPALKATTAGPCTSSCVPAAACLAPPPATGSVTPTADAPSEVVSPDQAACAACSGVAPEEAVADCWEDLAEDECKSDEPQSRLAPSPQNAPSSPYKSKTQDQAADKNQYRIKAKLHLVMEKVDGRGDLHAEITASRWWDCIRENGDDTGRRLRACYTMTDDDGDLYSYTMPRCLKLELAEELVRGMVELRRSNIVHCDIKPCNVLLVKVPNPKAGKHDMPGLKIIDFGEGNTPEAAAGFVAGTPGYQAPEVLEEGECSFSSDIYAVGVSLVELWTGEIWQGAETRGEGYEGMRHELLQALAKVERGDPKMGRLMRRCISETAKSRPTARQLLKAIKAVQAQSKPLVKAIAFRGRGWVAKKNLL